MQLKHISKSFYVYDFKGPKTIQGTPVKDVRDFVQIKGDDFEKDREVRYRLRCFFELRSNPIASNRLKTSTDQHFLLEEDTITVEPPSGDIEEELPVEAFPNGSLTQDYVNKTCRMRSVDTTIVAPRLLGTTGGVVGKNVDVYTTEGDEYLRLNTHIHLSLYKNREIKIFSMYPMSTETARRSFGASQTEIVGCRYYKQTADCSSESE